MKNNTEYIERLKDAVVSAFGQTLDAPTDYERLSVDIQHKTGELISASTLKRLFGYLDEGVSPRRFTLDVLSRFMGYKDYAGFLAGSGEAQSGIVAGERLSAVDLPTGRMLRLTWPPDRMCTVRHLGGCRFEVVTAENTKLCVGDTFSCSLFVRHEPLYLDNLVHCGGIPAAYVAGKRDGIMFELA